MECMYYIALMIIFFFAGRMVQFYYCGLKKQQKREQQDHHHNPQEIPRSTHQKRPVAQTGDVCNQNDSTIPANQVDYSGPSIDLHAAQDGGPSRIQANQQCNYPIDSSNEMLDQMQHQKHLYEAGLQNDKLEWKTPIQVDQDPEENLEHQLHQKQQQYHHQPAAVGHASLYISDPASISLSSSPLPGVHLDSIPKFKISIEQNMIGISNSQQLPKNYREDISQESTGNRLEFSNQNVGNAGCKIMKQDEIEKSRIYSSIKHRASDQVTVKIDPCQHVLQQTKEIQQASGHNDNYLMQNEKHNCCADFADHNFPTHKKRYTQVENPAMACSSPRAAIRLSDRICTEMSSGDEYNVEYQ